MTAHEGWENCYWCGEPLDERGDSGLISNAKSHLECAIRSIIGGLNHLQNRCTCCGGKFPPDPSGLTKREAAISAVKFWRLREAELRNVARRICHEHGLPYYNEHGEREDPPEIKSPR